MNAHMQPALPLPEPLRGEEEGTFAHNTVALRLPEIGRRTLAENEFPPERRRRLQALIDELPEGRVRPLQDHAAPDHQAWEAYCAPYLGQSWLQVPWFFAENYFYRRLLEAVDYFASGQDPFALQKRLGLETGLQAIERLAAGQEGRVERLRALPPAERGPAVKDLLILSLWGNQADLSLWPAGSPVQRDTAPPSVGPPAEEPAAHTQADREAPPSRLVVDHSAAIAAHLLGSPAARGPAPLRIDILLDNAGQELVNDLLLADTLLQAGLAQEVRLHAKAHPTFVSDALPADVLSTFDFLLRHPAPAARRLGMRLYRRLEAGRLRLRSDLFWNSPLPAWQMPPALREELAGSGLVISKGDAHYRRILGDRHWPFDTPLEAITAYRPAPLALLRVCKSEVAAGLQAGLAGRLQALDPGWMVNGTWGMIQFA